MWDTAIYNYSENNTATTFELDNIFNGIKRAYNQIFEPEVHEHILSPNQPQTYTSFITEHQKTFETKSALEILDHAEEINVPLKVNRKFTVKAKVIRRSKWQPQPFIDI